MNGVSATLHYDDADVVQELSGGMPAANRLLGLAVDEAFGRTDTAGTHTMLLDGIGSTIALVDSTGAIQTQYTYEPFGQTATSGSSNGNSFQFTSRENDGTGLYYYRARYYSPTLHRFISEDPIGFENDGNLYAYVGNNPITFVDPSGHNAAVAVAPWTGPWGWAAGGAAAAAWWLTTPQGQQFLTDLLNKARGGKRNLRSDDPEVAGASDEEVARRAGDTKDPEFEKFKAERKRRAEKEKQKRGKGKYQ